MRSAVFVGRGAHALVESEDEVFEGLESLKELVNARVEATGAGLEFLVGHAVEQPHVLRCADQRARAHARADEQWQAQLDRGGDAVVVAAVWREGQVQPFAHRRPVVKVRFVERADLPADIGRMHGDLMEQPRIKRRGPRHKGRLQCMRDAGTDQMLGDLEVGVAPWFVFQRVEQLAGHDHHLAVVMLLRDVEQRPVALRFEGGVILRTASRDAGDEALLRKLRAKALQHLGVEVIAQIEDVARVRIQHEDHFDTVMLAALLHPAHAFCEAVPVRLLVLEGQQRGHAQTRLRAVIDEFLLARVGPDRLVPGGGRLEIGGIGNEGAVFSHAPWCAGSAREAMTNPEWPG